MKQVIITGGSSGIGYHLAKGFAQHYSMVFVLDTIQVCFDELNIKFICTDLRDDFQITSAFEQIRQEYGAVHILINNGAVSKFHKPIEQLSTQEFDEVLSVNLRGSFLCSKAFVSANKGETFGRIINIASTRFQQNEKDWEVYGASKGGIISLTSSLCVSLSDTPITVNAISPGWIESSAYNMLTPADHKQHPSGRVGKPEDILSACLFLSDEKNDFINGANLVIDGGMTKRMRYD